MSLVAMADGRSDVEEWSLATKLTEALTLDRDEALRPALLAEAKKAYDSVIARGVLDVPAAVPGCSASFLRASPVLTGQSGDRLTRGEMILLCRAAPAAPPRPSPGVSTGSAECCAIRRPARSRKLGDRL